MDPHKKQHQVAWVHPDTGKIQEFTVANIAREIDRMVKRIRKQAPDEIHFCYEAGLCGFVLKQGRPHRMQLHRMGTKTPACIDLLALACYYGT